MNEAARTWGLRVLALGIAVGLWFSISFQDREALSERLVEASVTYNRPRDFVILDPVQNVNVRLRGSSKLIRQLNPYQVSVQVDLPQTHNGTVNVNLGPENVLAPDGLEVVSLEPNVIRVGLEREASLRLPVVPKLTGKPAAGTFAVASEAEVFPSLVLVSGPESHLAKVKSLSTRPISLDGHAITFEETAAVVPPDSLIQIVQPSRVSVRIPLHQAGEDGGAGSARKRGS